VNRGMIQYEILLLLDADLPEERESEIVNRIRGEIEGSGGTWESHDAWGRRKLAYEIDHKGDGSYHLLYFESAPETLAEISRVLKITDGVLRHLAVRRIKSSPQEAAPAVDAQEEAQVEPEPEIVREDG
jgi:small subunit ribosomal protein S6